jgi:hypothetical protein
MVTFCLLELESKLSKVGTGTALNRYRYSSTTLDYKILVTSY